MSTDSDIALAAAQAAAGSSTTASQAASAAALALSQTRALAGLDTADDAVALLVKPGVEGVKVKEALGSLATGPSALREGIEAAAGRALNGQVAPLVAEAIAADDAPAQAAAAAVDDALASEDVLVGGDPRAAIPVKRDGDVRWALVDESGRMPLWVDRAGKVHVERPAWGGDNVLASDGHAPSPEVSHNRVAWAVVDNDDRMPLWVTNAGHVEVARFGEGTVAAIDAQIAAYGGPGALDEGRVVELIDLYAPAAPGNDPTAGVTDGITARFYQSGYGANVVRRAVSGPDVLLAGHSMLAGATSAITSALTGRQVRSISVGGESMDMVSARFGAQPLRFTFLSGSIPASGSADVTFDTQDGSPGWPMLQGPSTYAVTLVLEDGTKVPGTFSVVRDPAATQYVHHAGDVYKFTRTTSGSAITTPRPVHVSFDVGAAARDDLVIYWAGRNGDWTTSTAVTGRIEAMEAMIRHQTSLDKRFLILSEHNSSTETSGTVYTNILEYNRAMRRKYGHRFIDTRAHLIAHGVTDAGLTATGQDTTDAANGVVPTSLRSDNLHLNASGNTVVASLIKRRLIQLEWNI